ncbi:unnamed protein product [Paramecium sonneborni]|uniref:WD domain, G-beta repeat protein n=1 Tax=Paramecium sonneborni TaxID=65129 RepID=A0A8S1LT70_9CILI|nr:unnamed protein product [Paramecium sonneborni]
MDKNCVKHGKRVVIVDRSSKDLQGRNLCIQCLTEQKNNLISYEDVQQELHELKAQLIKEKYDLNKKNIDLLDDLKNNLWQLKSQISALIDKHLECFEQQIQLISDSQNKFGKQIESLETKDLDSFVKQYSEIEKQFINYQDIKDLLLKNLSSLSNDQLIQRFAEILSKINTGMLNYSNEVMSNFKQQFTLLQANNASSINLTCKQHNGCQIIMVDLNEIQKAPSRLICVKCMSAYPAKYETIDEFKEQWQNYLQEKQNYCSNYIEKVESKTKELNLLFSDIQLKIANQITKSTNQLNERSNDLLNIFQKQWQQDKNQNFSLKNFNEFEDIVKQMSGSQNIQHLISCLESNCDEWNKLYLQQISEIQQTLEICTENLKNSINIKLNAGKDIYQETKSLLNSQVDKQFTYELIKESSIKQDQFCGAMSFNKDCSIVIVGCENQIKVFEFTKGRMNQIQLLSEHNMSVVNLKFMKKSDQFISGSERDGQIIIWSMNPNKKWIYQQKINAHTKCIECILLNNNEDLIISSSRDGTIKFWIKQSEWACQQTIAGHEGYVYSLSLNEQQNRLISCSKDKSILVIDLQQQDNKWIIKQKINLDKYGYRLCFIDDNLFTFQPYQQEQLNIYELNSTNGQYVKTKVVQVKCGQDDGYTLFPQQYIKQKSLLVNKNGQNINLIKIKQNEQFLTKQIIQFQSSYLYGCMSDDAEYLITWDQISNEIQIRQYNQK